MQFRQLKRREFNVGLSGMAAALLRPLTLAAQPARVPRIGYVWIGDSGTDASYAGLRQGLEDRGYVLGRSLLFEARYAHGNADQVPGLIADLLALNVDVLVTVGTLISRAAQRATSTVPIVMVSGDPVGAGLAASLARPGGNITGLSLLSADYSSKWLELLIEAAPKLNRVAVLWNPDNPVIDRQVERMRETARRLALELTALSARPTELEASVATLGSAGVDAFVVSDDPILEPLLPRLIALAAEHRLPALYGFSVAVKRGGLMSYSADFFDLWLRAAGYVDRILKGARPADLPIEQATKLILKINLKTAKALGLTIPLTLQAAADEVIE
jgi:putative tryptophan/tyrosine transport system substrate-binding protein